MAGSWGWWLLAPGGDPGGVLAEVAVALDEGGRRVEPGEVVLVQPDAEGTEVLVDAGRATGAGDRDDRQPEALALRVEPGERDLGRRGPDLGGHGGHHLHDALVGVEAGVEPWVTLEHRPLDRLAGHRAGEEPAPEWRVGHEAGA